MAARALINSAHFAVLVYHGLTAAGTPKGTRRERKFWIRPPQLRAHLSELLALEYQSRTLRELWSRDVQYKESTGFYGLTFDDGRESDYEIAFPILQELGLSGDFFVNTANIGKPGYLTWARMRQMQQAGMSFQSHSHDHVDLSRLSGRVLTRQLRESKLRLEDELGTAVSFLAAPYGLCHRRVVIAACEEGYRAVCTSQNWPAQPGNPIMSRVVLHGNTRVTEVVGLVKRDLSHYTARLLRQAVLYVPKKLALRFWPRQLGIQILEQA